MTRALGWLPDLPDHRDYKLQLVSGVEYPSAVDLQPLMPPVQDQGALGSCHDAETDVLTDTGWKRFSDLDGSERLASVDPVTEKLIFETPTRIIRFPYLGKVYRCSNRSQRFRVTPDHKMLVRKWDEAARTLTDSYSFVPISEIGWYSGLMNRVEWAGEATGDVFTLPGVNHKHVPQRSPRDIPLGSWLRFLGIYCAEGTLLRDAKHRFKIQLAASKEREKGFIRQTLSEMGVIALELSDRFTFQNQQIYEAVAALGLRGIDAGRKFVPTFIFRHSAAMIREFLAGHFAGDGCEQYGIRAHYTGSSRLADDLQALIFMSGQETRLTVRAARSAVTANGRVIVGVLPEHRVSVCERKNQSIERKRQIIVEDYDGEVFCAEVPTYHTLVTRRDGTVLISGNCTAHAVAAAHSYQQLLEKKEVCIDPSRLFIYYNSRLLEGTTRWDSGATLRDAIKSVARYGVCAEKTWDYNIARYKVRPAKSAYITGMDNQAVIYQRVYRSMYALRGCLASNRPFVFGFTVYSSFLSDDVAATGVVPIPEPSEAALGGHAVLCVGYDDSEEMFVCRNSWGDEWGNGGYFRMQYAYLMDENLSDDFWNISLVE